MEKIGVQKLSAIKKRLMATESATKGERILGEIQSTE